MEFLSTLSQRRNINRNSVAIGNNPSDTRLTFRRYVTSNTSEFLHISYIIIAN